MTWTSFSTGSLINKDIQGLSYHVYRVFIIYTYMHIYVYIYIYRGSQCGHPRKLHNCRRVSRTDHPRGWLLFALEKHSSDADVACSCPSCRRKAVGAPYTYTYTRTHTYIIYLYIYIYIYIYIHIYIYIFIIHINRHSANRTLHTVILLANLKQSRKHLGLWADDI